MYPFAEFLHLKLKFVEENPLRGIRIYTCNLIRGEPTRISQIVSNSHAPFRARNPSVSPISSQIVIRLYFVTLTQLRVRYEGGSRRERDVARRSPEGDAMSGDVESYEHTWGMRVSGRLECDRTWNAICTCAWHHWRLNEGYALSRRPAWKGDLIAPRHLY